VLGRDVVDILKARIAAEQRYAKELAAIASKANSLADTDSSLPAAWVVLRDSHSARAEMHSVLVKKLEGDVMKVVADGLKERSTKKGSLSDEDKSLHTQLNKHKKATDDALLRYMQASAAGEASKKQFHFAQQDASIPPKKLKAMETQEAKLSSDAEKAHEAYKSTLADLNAFQKTYETSLGNLLNNLQELDESGGAMLHNMMKTYLDAHLVLNKTGTQLNEKCTSAVEKIDPAKDLQAWIKAQSNGFAPEALVEYEPYEPQFENATAEEVKNPTKVARGFSKNTLKKGSVDGGKKLQRQKSLSRLMGNKSRGVSKKDTLDTRKTSVSSPNAPVIGSPTSASKGDSNPPKTVSYVDPSPSPKQQSQPPKKTKPGRQAKALFEFIASDDSEISFAVGDIITVVREDESGWWDCDKDGDLGLAPGNYLEFLEEEESAKSSPTPRKMDEAPSSDDENETIAIVAPVSKAPEPEPEPEPEESSEPNVDQGGGDGDEDEDEEEAEPIGFVSALYDFAGDGEDELPLAVGEEIEVYAEVEGWYTGTNAEGMYGLFPKNFCGPISDERKT
jgi:hypothetical protein